MATTISDEIEEQFLGKWKTVQTEGMPQLREAFNISIDVVSDNPRSEMEISKEGEGVYFMVSKSEWGTKTTRTEIGKPCKDEVMGREIDMVTTWEGPRLTTRVLGSRSDMMTREVVDGKLVSIVHIHGVVIKTIAEKC